MRTIEIQRIKENEWWEAWERFILGLMEWKEVPCENRSHSSSNIESGESGRMLSRVVNNHLHNRSWKSAAKLKTHCNDLSRFKNNENCRTFRWKIYEAFFFCFRVLSFPTGKPVWCRYFIVVCEILYCIIQVCSFKYMLSFVY